MPPDPYDDEGLCTAAYPGDGLHAGQLCCEPLGHSGDHRALAEVGPGWRRHLVWSGEESL